MDLGVVSHARYKYTFQDTSMKNFPEILQVELQLLLDSHATDSLMCERAVSARLCVYASLVEECKANT